MYHAPVKQNLLNPWFRRFFALGLLLAQNARMPVCARAKGCSRSLALAAASHGARADLGGLRKARHGVRHRRAGAGKQTDIADALNFDNAVLHRIAGVGCAEFVTYRQFCLKMKQKVVTDTDAPHFDSGCGLASVQKGGHVDGANY